MMAHFDYPTFFACAAGLVIALYVVLDGFDLGVGIIFPFAPLSSDRDTMMQTLAPTWDGNETWLVLGGMVLLVGFPAAFSVLLPAFYVPLCVMLFGLVLRGVAFEFRSQSGPFQPVWSAAFSGGSAIAAFCQGAVLGAFLDERIAVRGGMFVGGPFDWLHPFSIATGLGVVAGYAVLGAGWLIWRTSGHTQIFAKEIVKPALVTAAVAILLISVWTSVSLPHVATRWFSWPSILMLAPLPALGAVAWITAWRSVWSVCEWRTFVAAVVLFLSALVGLGVSIWPAAIPGAMTIWEASSAPRTQALMAPAIALIIPVILSYVAFSYWVFRGKAGAVASGN